MLRCVLACMIAMIGMVEGQASTITFDTSTSTFTAANNQGWWGSDGAAGTTANYATGDSGGVQLRSFFSFNLAGLTATDTITQAVLRLTRGTVGDDVEANEQVNLFDVSTAPAALNAHSGTDVSVFSDLGAGASYGSFGVATSGAVADPVNFTLNNSSVLADLNASKGNWFSIGAALAEISGEDFLFGKSD